MKKVYVVGYSTGYSRFIHNMNLVNNIEEADIVLFTGGEDISPELYGCKKHETTYFTRRRDEEEVSAFNKMRPNQLAVGICRGAQLFCALNGGILVTNPIPAKYAMDEKVINKAIKQAQSEMEKKGIKGKDETPFLLARIVELTKGDSLDTNIQLVLNNAKLGAQIAKAYCALKK